MTTKTEQTPVTDASGATTPKVTIESHVDQAKRAFALQKYEQAVEHYANALELATAEHGEDAPQTADLYLAYGRALLENAISQNSVLGKEQNEEEDDAPSAPSGSGLSKNGPILSFSGDAEDEEDTAVDLFAQASKDIAEAEAMVNAANDEEEEDEGEPEDDFNAAWEVLDLARAIYDKRLSADEDDEVKLKLADTYITLGDVSLETEKFEQAVSDYEAGLKLKADLLPISSRQIAEAHYKLSIVLDLTPGKLSDSIAHAEKALESVEKRLSELQEALSSGVKSEATEQKVDTKGKGKASSRKNPLKSMSQSQIEAEIKEVTGLKEDLALKVEELKTSPTDSVETSAPALAAQQLDQELKAAPAAPAETPVNDLTMVVKKKKKPVDESAAVKRKAEDDPNGSPGEKKAKLESDSI
ncbi:hypothetical protein ONZ45_g12686 [Pleurotus djamor]|nr:hypothetical protein ONZ45_g12686 [Pleurotus djamor]